MRVRNAERPLILALTLLLPLLGLSNDAGADTPANVPSQYRNFFRHYVDDRSFTEKALNAIGFSKEDVGRSFALLAGVAQYPKMQGTAANLTPALADIEKLAAYLVQREFFDEVVVLLDDAVNDASLGFFLERYFPQRLSEFPKSRFLFAYSGHGTTRPDGRGYLLTTDASNLSDTRNSISLKKIRAMMDEVVYNGHFVLALVNACYAADLHGRQGFGGEPYWPKLEGAHVITAGGTGEPTWHDPSLGAGSIFFETLLAGLDGRADYNGEGIISFKELDAYLTDKIKQFTGEQQNPVSSDLNTQPSRGGFFFLDQQRMVERKVLAAWDPRRFLPFGGQRQAALPVSPAPSPQPVKPPVQPAVGLFSDMGRKPGEVFKDCPECPEMVVVPSGSFLMGSPNSEQGREKDEGPQHRVMIAKPFAVGKYDVTFAEWDACVAARGCEGYGLPEVYRLSDSGFGRGRQPVNNANWNDAQAYVRWLSARTGKPYRLLSEAEWEYAARAGTNTAYHTGAKLTTKQANYDTGDRTVEVGSFPPNAFGLHDMHGNVWEWVEDCYHASYRDAPSDGSAWVNEHCKERVARGGGAFDSPSYALDWGDARSADRLKLEPGQIITTVLGFRVARAFVP